MMAQVLLTSVPKKARQSEERRDACRDSNKVSLAKLK